MMNETGVGWTDLTWNLFSGCKVKSAGCRHCYAEGLAEQRRGTPAFPFGFDFTLRPKNLDDPRTALRRHGPSLVFCESMSDIGLDDDELTPAEVDRLTAAGFSGLDAVRHAFFAAILARPEHRYQLVTKRPEILLRYFRETGQRVPASCWVGVTIEHASTLHRLETLHELRGLGALVLFVSLEPLLGDLVSAGLRLDGIDWAIGGGESGTHAKLPEWASRFLVARAMHSGRDESGAFSPRPVGPWRPREDRIGWVRAIRDEAKRAGCAFFFKQWGGPTPNSGGRLLDGVTHDGMPAHILDAMPPGRRVQGAATAALARKLPVVSE